jgi:hypothetical protein
VSNDFQVTKIGYSVPISCCLAAQYGMGQCEHPELPPLTRRQRFRWWLRDTWDRRPRVHLSPCNHDDCEW